MNTATSAAIRLLPERREASTQSSRTALVGGRRPPLTAAKASSRAASSGKPKAAHKIVSQQALDG
jgi:hypothetical protein